jgi:hypothetical protein
MINGENVALVMYSLVKGDPSYPDIHPVVLKRLEAAGYKPKAKAGAPVDTKPAETPKVEKTQERIEKNLKKTPTMGGTGAGGNDGHELSAADIYNMSDEDFRKLPKARREAILRSV